MKKLIISIAIMLCLSASFAFAQVFPPVWIQGPFPTGTETVRNDAPFDITMPDAMGTIHEYTAYRGTPVIDGDVDNDAVWNSIPWTAMDTYDIQGQPDTYCFIFDGACDGNANYWGPDDITAWFKVLWDDENVYFALKKVDNEYVFNEAHMNDLPSMWQDDAYQIVLSANDPFDQSGPEPVAEVGVGLLDYTETAYTQWVNTNDGLVELAEGNGTSAIAACDGKAFFATQTETETGYTEVMEVAFVKWDAIVADTPQMMSVMANDIDEDHIVDALQWSRGIFNGKLPERYASIVYSSLGAPTAVEDKQPNVPVEFALLQNYPNPFNPTTTIEYSLKTTSQVKLTILNLLGAEVATLVNNTQTPGDYRVTFDGANLTGGVYFCKITAGDFAETQRMVLLK